MLSSITTSHVYEKCIAVSSGIITVERVMYKDNDNEKRILQRWYWALVVGTPRCSKGVISAPLGKVST